VGACPALFRPHGGKGDTSKRLIRLSEALPLRTVDDTSREKEQEQPRQKDLRREGLDRYIYGEREREGGKGRVIVCVCVCDGVCDGGEWWKEEDRQKGRSSSLSISLSLSISFSALFAESV
jgi:hypothetical protein